MNLLVNGREVSQLKAPRYTSVLLPPGRHVVGVSFGGLAGPQNAPVEQVLDLAAGEVVALRAGISMGALKNALTLQRVPLDDGLKSKLGGMTMVASDES